MKLCRGCSKPINNRRRARCFECRQKEPSVALPCRHCGNPVVTRPRGLCWTCYYTPGLRDLYPSTSKFGPKGLDIAGLTPLPQPTEAMPGTAEKVRVLEERANRHQTLFHPDDAVYSGVATNEALD